MVDPCREMFAVAKTSLMLLKHPRIVGTDITHRGVHYFMESLTQLYERQLIVKDSKLTVSLSPLSYAKLFLSSLDITASQRCVDEWMVPVRLAASIDYQLPLSYTFSC